MLSYWLNCRKNTKCKNQVLKTKNRRIARVCSAVQNVQCALVKNLGDFQVA